MEWIVEAETLSDLIDHGRYSVSSRPLIRCKDCKHYLYPHGCGHIDGMATSQKDGFCSYAERREE